MRGAAMSQSCDAGAIAEPIIIWGIPPFVMDMT